MRYHEKSKHHRDSRNRDQGDKYYDPRKSIPREVEQELEA